MRLPTVAAAVLPLLLAAPAAAQKTETLSLPPESLAQWYPPQSETQEFRSLMFKLGRAMQASGDYHALEEKELLAKWAGRLTESYRRIGEMVPEWKGELEFEWADRLDEAAAAGDFSTVGSALHRIGTSCGSCHREYRPAVQVLYHVPDWEQAVVESSETLEEVPYPKAMERLGTAMQRLGIALEDGRMDAAKSNAAKLSAQLDDLAASCSGCHQDPAPKEQIFDAGVASGLEALGAAVEGGDAAAAGEALGKVGRPVCGSCHKIHRPAAAIRHAIAPHEH